MHTHAHTDTHRHPTHRHPTHRHTYVRVCPFIYMRCTCGCYRSPRRTGLPKSYNRKPMEIVAEESPVTMAEKPFQSHWSIKFMGRNCTHEPDSLIRSYGTRCPRTSIPFTPWSPPRYRVLNLSRFRLSWQCHCSSSLSCIVLFPRVLVKGALVSAKFVIYRLW